MNINKIVSLLKESNLDDKDILEGVKNANFIWKEKLLSYEHIQNIYKIRLRNKPLHLTELVGLEDFVHNMSQRKDEKIIYVSIDWDNNHRAVFITEDEKFILGII